MTKTARKPQNLVTLKVTLRGIRPPIWRRLVIPGHFTLGDLHQAIQAVMDWGGFHLHVFNIDGRQYGDRSIVDDVADEERLTVDDVVKLGVNRFAYVYDFGDDWVHSVLIEKRKPPLRGGPYPACIAGKRNCPPEDCGGPWGYENLLAVMADPTNPELSDWAEWIDEEFDPEEFTVEYADISLGARFRRT